MLHVASNIYVTYIFTVPMLILGHTARENSRTFKTGSATNARYIIVTEYPILFSNSISNMLVAFYTDRNNTFHRS